MSSPPAITSVPQSSMQDRGRWNMAIGRATTAIAGVFCSPYNSVESPPFLLFNHKVELSRFPQVFGSEAGEIVSACSNDRSRSLGAVTRGHAGSKWATKVVISHAPLKSDPWAGVQIGKEKGGGRGVHHLWQTPGPARASYTNFRSLESFRTCIGSLTHLPVALDPDKGLIH